MSGETLQEIHRRLGLPDIPQELIDQARQQLEEQERVLSDPVRKAARLAETRAILSQFSRPRP